MKRKFLNFLFTKTKKPENYVRVRKPKTLQDYRQISFNNWCKAKKVYCGAFMPEEPDDLLNKGWIETKGGKKNRNFIRKSTKQKVRFDSEKVFRQTFKPKHYHWLFNDDIYYNYYGQISNDKKSPMVHFSPLDKDYKEIKLWRKK